MFNGLHHEVVTKNRSRGQSKGHTPIVYVYSYANTDQDPFLCFHSIVIGTVTSRDALARMHLNCCFQNQ